MFAYISTNSTISGLTGFDFSNPFIVLANVIGADPADVSAIPFDLKLPAEYIIRKLLYGFIV